MKRKAGLDSVYMDVVALGCKPSALKNPYCLGIGENAVLLK